MTVRKFLIVAALVLTAGNASVASTQEAVGVEAFLRRIYAPYIAGDAGVNPTGNAASTIFDARLIALICKDEAQPQGEIGVLDADPICDCQDFDRIKLRSIKFLNRNSIRATAVVQFTNLNTTSVLKYTLIKSRHGWRVSDIATKDMPSLVALLQGGTAHR